MLNELKIYINDNLLDPDIYICKADYHFNGVYRLPHVADVRIWSEIKDIDTVKFIAEFKRTEDSLYLYPYDENILSLL